MTQARLLKALVIHDSDLFEETPAYVLGTTDLELCGYKLPRHHDVRVLRSWEDVIHLLSALSDGGRDERELPTPDLLLMDCDFGKDSTAPKLVGADYDPRGLLYGATLVAHFVGSRGRRAFGFAPYGQEMSRAAPLPYAQTFYSLLSAMLESPPDVVEAKHYQDLIYRHPSGQQPGDVVRSAVRRYRHSLVRMLDGSLDPDLESFETALARVRAFRQQGVPIPEDLYLSWREGHRQTSVLLRSLFCDYRRNGAWEVDALAEAGDKDAEIGLEQLLEAVISSHSYARTILRPTQVILEAARRGAPAWDSSLSELENQRALALSVLWAEDRARVAYRQGDRRRQRKGTGLKQFYETLGIDANQTKRALGGVLPVGEEREGLRPIDFIRLLDESRNWPFEKPVWLPNLVCQHLREGHQRGRLELEARYWPRCLRSFAGVS